MDKILYVFFSIIAFSVSGTASDRPEDVIRKADRDFAKQDVECRHLARALSDPHHGEEGKRFHLPKPKSLTSQEIMTKLRSEVGCPVLTSQELRTQREEHNDQLMHALNAGISLLSDYLVQFQEDNDLTWTFETFPIYAGVTGTELIPLDGIHMIEENINGISCNALPTAYFYEIMRQKSCVDLSTLLSLMHFWKKTIFPDATIRSYSSLDALALKQQVLQRADRLKERTGQLKNQKLWKLNCEKSIIFVLEDLLAEFPVGETLFVKGLKFPKNLDLKEKEKITLINKKKTKYDIFYINSIELTAKLSSELCSLIMNPLKQFVQPHYIQDFKLLYNIYLKSLVSPGSEKKKNILDLKQLFLQIHAHYPLTNEEFSEEKAPEKKPVPYVDDVLAMQFSLILELVSSHLIQPQEIYNNLIKRLDNRSLSCLASANKFLYENLSKILGNRLEEYQVKKKLFYAEDYWKTENSVHQERKNQMRENISSIQRTGLTNYEINLFTFLKENIFKINCHLKVSKLKSDLSGLFFDVVVNRNGNGSLHYISSRARNPLFGNNAEYQGAYFNVHLPHSNAVIPPGYFRYLQSGFENIFGLSSDYIDNQLEPTKSNKGSLEGKTFNSGL